jgi:hypothetical protein
LRKKFLPSDRNFCLTCLKVLFRASSANFYRAPAGCDGGKGDRKRARRKAEKEKYGTCVCCYLVCTGPPPPTLSPILPTCLTHLRLWLSGQDIQQGGPPFCYPHPFSGIGDPNCGAPRNFSATLSLLVLLEVVWAVVNPQQTSCKHNNTLCGDSTISKPY